MLPILANSECSLYCRWTWEAYGVIRRNSLKEHSLMYCKDFHLLWIQNPLLVTNYWLFLDREGQNIIDVYDIISHRVFCTKL